MAKKIESTEVLEDEVLDVEETEDEVECDENEFEADPELTAAVAGGAVGGGLGFMLGYGLGRKVEKAKTVLKGANAEGEEKPQKEKKSFNPFKGLKLQAPIVRVTEEVQSTEPKSDEPKSEVKAEKKKSKK